MMRTDLKIFIFKQLEQLYENKSKITPNAKYYVAPIKTFTGKHDHQYSSSIKHPICCIAVGK